MPKQIEPVSTNPNVPLGRYCEYCDSYWNVPTDVDRVTCANCGGVLPAYCPNNDYHAVRSIEAKNGKPLRFNCVNGCLLGKDGFTADESASMRSLRADIYSVVSVNWRRDDD